MNKSSFIVSQTFFFINYPMATKLMHTSLPKYEDSFSFRSPCVVYFSFKLLVQTKMEQKLAEMALLKYCRRNRANFLKNRCFDFSRKNKSISFNHHQSNTQNCESKLCLFPSKFHAVN